MASPVEASLVGILRRKIPLIAIRVSEKAAADASGLLRAVVCLFAEARYIASGISV
jgi:hypothetical protein